MQEKCPLSKKKKPKDDQIKRETEYVALTPKARLRAFKRRREIVQGGR